MGELKNIIIFTSWHYSQLYLAEECKKQGQAILDSLFAMVMDFSAAEAAGFVTSFKEFWLLQPDDSQSPEELASIAGTMFKGCKQHFRAGVTHLKKISGVVKPSLADAFEARALALLDAEDMSTFNSWASALLRDFPHFQGWISWWQ